MVIEGKGLLVPDPVAYGRREVEDIPAPVDLHFARLLERLSGGKAPSLFIAAVLVSRSAREGSICLDLGDVAGKALPFAAGLPRGCPELAAWRAELETSPVVGKPGEERPLILDPASRLYLYRYWEYEADLARFLLRESGRKPCPETFALPAGLDAERLREGLDRLFPRAAGGPGGEDEVNWQKVAALAVLLQQFTVITGGPGTGKTVTAAKAVILLLEQSRGPRLRIALAAPTGKAAARLQEAVSRIAEAWCTDPQVREGIPTRAMTLHRLLGSIPNSSRFRHHEANPLPVDAVVVDEASMVDLPLLAKLVRALPEKARLILLGDRNQLASVEAGAVLSDICGDQPLNRFSKGFSRTVSTLTGFAVAATPDLPGGGSPPIRDALVELQTNYRFPGESGIHRLSLAVNRGSGSEAFSILDGKGSGECRWKRIPDPGDLSSGLKEIIIKHFKEYSYPIDHIDQYGECLDIFSRFRILCALRRGPYGVTEVNRLCERILFDAGLIPAVGPWYPGRPVMITQNDDGIKLFNGDVGLILPDPDRRGETGAYFRDTTGGLRRIAPIRLPAHETVHALTVHKSQGSEFDHVLVILPDRDSPVLTRELIYTAVTRARKSVTVWGEKESFMKAVSRRTLRSSGLRDALRRPTVKAAGRVAIQLDN